MELRWSAEGPDAEHLALDVAELASALQRNRSRIRVLEGQLSQARRSPTELADLATTARAKTEASMAELRAQLDTPEGLRFALLEIEPDGLKLYRAARQTMVLERRRCG